MKRLLPPCVTLMVLVSAITSPAQVPRTTSIQGVVLDEGGGPVADGVHELVFSLYEADSGGDVIGSTGQYEPGDVLIVSATDDRSFELSSEPYSTAVSGVYATRPGVLLADEGVEIYPKGAILGKALRDFDGSGAGVIEVLVGLK